MEQVESIPFSSIIATLLLRKTKVNPFDIVNFISEISQGEDDIIYCVEDDDLDCLSICVDNIINVGEFKIKGGMDYDTVLYDNTTVKDFLVQNSIYSKVKGFGAKENEDRKIGENFCEKVTVISSVITKKKIRTPWLLRRV